jgi:hypothetical protein
MGYNNPQAPSGSDDDVTKIGALSDGFASTATNNSDVDDSNVGAANGNNRNNADNSTDNSVDVDAKVDIAAGNGDNRENDYDWSYDSKSYSDNDTNTKTTSISDNDTSVKSDYDWSYESKSDSHNDTKTVTHTDTDTDIKSVSTTDTDIKTTTTTTTDSFNSSDSFYKTDTDFAVLDGVKDFGNLGIAGGDLTFNLGDDFSFTLDVDNILNNSLNGEGNDAGFSLVQANHLADQDNAWDTQMQNGGAQNQLSANAAEAHSSDGMNLDGKGWDLKAGDDAHGASTADASAILANSGFHMELVQGANLLSNTFDATVTGADSHISTVGEDTGS